MFSDPVQILGLVAGALTTGALLPQVIKSWKTKSAGDVSYGMYILYILAFILWISYGVLKSDIPIIATNILSITQSVIMLVFKWKFKDNDTDKKG
jgi:MtN3 and saliva related transmembrane protein